MKTITYQTKYFGMMRKRITVALLLLTIIVGQSVSFIPAGQLAGYSKYNLSVSTTTGLDGAGGFSFSGSGFTYGVGYFLKVSFDRNNWYNIASGTATDGSLSAGIFQANINGAVQIAFSHVRMNPVPPASPIPWPGDDGFIYLRVSNATQTNHWPALGEEFTLDLTSPEILTTSFSVGSSAKSIL